MDGKTRLIKVVLSSVNGNREVLGSAKKFKESETWSSIFITLAMSSAKEREKNKKLREDLKRRRDNGEEGLVIRHCTRRSNNEAEPTK